MLNIIGMGELTMDKKLFYKQYFEVSLLHDLLTDNIYVIKEILSICKEKNV